MHQRFVLRIQEFCHMHENFAFRMQEPERYYQRYLLAQHFEKKKTIQILEEVTIKQYLENFWSKHDIISSREEKHASKDSHDRP